MFSRGCSCPQGLHCNLLHSCWLKSPFSVLHPLKRFWYLSVHAAGVLKAMSKGFHWLLMEQLQRLSLSGIQRVETFISALRVLYSYSPVQSAASHCCSEILWGALMVSPCQGAFGILVRRCVPRWEERLTLSLTCNPSSWKWHYVLAHKGMGKRITDRLSQSQPLTHPLITHSFQFHPVPKCPRCILLYQNRTVTQPVHAVHQGMWNKAPMLPFSKTQIENEKYDRI